METFFKPKKTLVTLSVLMGMFLFLALTTLFLGTPTEDVTTVTEDLEQAAALEQPTDDAAILAQREERVQGRETLHQQITSDIEALMDTGDYDQFQETYGLEMRVLLEQEIPTLENKTVAIDSQPLIYGDTIYPIDIVLGEHEVNISTLYAYSTGELTPQYIHLEQEAQ